MNHPTTRAITEWIASSVAILILAFTAIIQIENNLISDRIDKKYVTLARIVLPQGWNFFTKPPTDSDGVSGRCEWAPGVTDE